VSELLLNITAAQNRPFSAMPKNAFATAEIPPLLFSALTTPLSGYEVCPYVSDFQPGFREHLPRVPQLGSKIYLACKITPDNVAEILSVNFFCLKSRLYASFCINLLC